MFDPTDEVANVPTAEMVFNVTVSPAITPTKAALPTFKVAAVVPSYVLLFAVMPATVKFFWVIFAVVVGSVKE
jgi:hypothetical protein